MSVSDYPRPEYPRPQFRRDDWLCLNGQWQFEIDAGDSGLQRDLQVRDLSGEITVPFCPESDLSGIGHKDFMHAVWYRREITIPPEWAGRHALLHFGAVDYDATVWIVRPATESASVIAAKEEEQNETTQKSIVGHTVVKNGFEITEVIRHRGGFTPFTCNLREVAQPGETVQVVLRARDSNNVAQPRGKQASTFYPESCFYTRTTGIWQTVWMEPVHEFSLKRARITPDLANNCFHIVQPLTKNRRGLTLRARLMADGETLHEATVRADLDLSPHFDLKVPHEKRRLWSPSDPFLYDITIELLDTTDDNRVLDCVQSYAGLRSLAIEGKKVLLNGEPIFQRLVLDQGYYPDGVMTAPTDEALKNDILLSQAVGFNGARLHQKIFEERFLYHADKLGYMVWGEFPDWGCSGYGPQHDHQTPTMSYVAQWLEELERDYSHPSIVGWCGLNETHQSIGDKITLLDDATRAMFLAAKAMDTSRPVLDTSGYSHRVLETDVYDSHDYIIDDDFAKGLEKFKRRHALTDDPKKPLSDKEWRQGGVYINANGYKQMSTPYCGQPYFISEFGGFRWNPAAQKDDSMVTDADGKMKPSERKESWGYGSSPVSVEDFNLRFEAVCKFLLDHEEMFGYCYTQLTDIFPEENGLYTFDRQPKFDNAFLKAVQERKAAVEKKG